jgi:thiamine pyrophosphokinase
VKKKERIVIFAAGDIPEVEDARSHLREGDIIICADGGLRHAMKLRVLPRAIIGDLDSISRSTIWELIEAGVRIMRYPAEKDRTDLDLACEYAFSLNPSSVTVLGALGRRSDHFLANVFLLVKYWNPRVPLHLIGRREELFLTGSTGTLHESPGTRVSLIPLSPSVEGITLEGFSFPLKGETLSFGDTRGVSNVLSKGKGSFSVREGHLLAVVHRAPAHK